MLLGGNDPKNALVIYMDKYINVKNIQSLVLYNRTGTLSVMSRAIGLAVEFYDTNKDNPSFVKPLLQTQEINDNSLTYRFDFPEIANYPVSDYVSSNAVGFLSTEYIINNDSDSNYPTQIYPVNLPSNIIYYPLDTDIEFNTVVIRRPNGKKSELSNHTISFAEIQLWLNDVNILHEFGIISTTQYTSGLDEPYEGEAEFVVWTTKKKSIPYFFNGYLVASNAFNNKTFPTYDVTSSANNSDLALIIPLSSSFKVKDIQSIVYYTRSGGSYFSNMSVGLAIELYYDSNLNGNFTTPIIQTPEISGTFGNQGWVRFDFPELKNYSKGYETINDTSITKIIDNANILKYDIDLPYVSVNETNEYQISDFDLTLTYEGK
jgi:hypothetical protein